MTGAASITLATDEISVAVEAHRGGRITRLADRRGGRQWLIGPRGAGARVRLDAVYTETDHYGWDEMLPTIDPGTYRGAPYDGVVLADHGELWSASWEVLDQSATTLRQRAVGRRLRFTFDRLLEVSGAELHCSYRCETPVDTALLWALHPQFAALEGTRLELTPSPTTVLEGPLGALRARAWDGEVLVERDVEEGSDLMLYADPADPVASASLSDPSGASLTMTWDTEACPYLAIWVDRGRYSAGRVIAVEPTNAFVDDLTWAVANGRATNFLAHEPRTWWVKIEVSSGREVSQ